MKVAMLTTDNRENYRRYSGTHPFFGTAPEALLQGFALMPDVEVHVLSCTQQKMISPEKLASNIWFHSLHVPKSGWLRTAYQGCVRAVREKLREIRPDIVHGQGTERDCALAAVRSGFPSVLTIHGNMRIIARLNRAPLFSYQWLAARMETYAVPRAGGVVCITRYTQEAMRGRARKTWLLPNATDAGYFTVPAGRDAAGPPVIACAGFVCLRKNQNAFIRALDPVAARHKFRLVFFGEAPKTEAYAQEFFGLLATRPWCEYVGFVNRDQFKEWLGRASLLALPSLEDNCPMTVLEAAATSTPVVAANVGGVPELVEDGRTGLLCDPTSADSMAGAVEKLLTQPALARALATEAHRIALERFHPLPVARGHLKIYREVLQKN